MTTNECEIDKYTKTYITILLAYITIMSSIQIFYKPSYSYNFNQNSTKRLFWWSCAMSPENIQIQRRQYKFNTNLSKARKNVIRGHSIIPDEQN